MSSVTSFRLWLVPGVVLSAGEGFPPGSGSASVVWLCHRVEARFLEVSVPSVPLGRVVGSEETHTRWEGHLPRVPSVGGMPPGRIVGPRSVTLQSVHFLASSEVLGLQSPGKCLEKCNSWNSPGTFGHSNNAVLFHWWTIRCEVSLLPRHLQSWPPFLHTPSTNAHTNARTLPSTLGPGTDQSPLGGTAPQVTLPSPGPSRPWPEVAGQRDRCLDRIRHGRSRAPPSISVRALRERLNTSTRVHYESS